MQKNALEHPKKGSRNVIIENKCVTLRTFLAMLIKKFSISCLLLLLAPSFAMGQSEATSVFDFLRLPTSSHSMALGGTNITLWDDDASLLFQNPALMSNVSSRSINLGFMTYMRGCKAGNASWVMAHRERGTWGVGVQFVGYGSMKETTVEGIEVGDFSALDMCITGGYSYMLTEYLSGGATGKFIYSKYGDYSSIGLAIDLGLNYYDAEKDLSVSLVGANIGGQVKAFGDSHEPLPFDLRLGLTKRLSGAPLQFSFTMVDLTRWGSSDFYNPSGGTVGFGRKLTSHFLIGVDIIPMQQVYLSAAYNFRRAYEMKAAGGSHGAGLCFGAGLNLKKIKIGLSYAKYHLSVPSFMINAQYTL